MTISPLRSLITTLGHLPASDAPCPPPATRATSDASTASGFNGSPDRDASAIVTPEDRAASCFEAVTPIGGCGVRHTPAGIPFVFTLHVSTPLPGCVIASTDVLASSHADLLEAYESLLPVIKSLAHAFFEGPGLIKLGKALQISPLKKKDEWLVENKVNGASFALKGPLPDTESVRKTLTMPSDSHSPFCPSEASIAAMKEKIVRASKGYTLFDHETHMQLFSLPDNTIHIISAQDMSSSPITLKFANGLVLLGEGPQKGYTIYKAPVQKEPYHQDARTELQIASDAFIDRVVKILHGKPHKTSVMLADAITVKRDLAFIVSEDFYRLRIRNQQTGSETLIKPGYTVVEIGDTPEYLAIAPYKYRPTIHIPEATLKEYDDKVEAFQKEGKRAYKYQPHGGISVYAFPDNTIAVCSHSGFGGFNLQLTFADGTVFFTKDVVQGIAHYKIGSTDTICDAAALSPREVSIKPISSVLGGEERREVQEEFEKLQAKIADFQRAGKHVATTEFEPGTFIYSFPDNTISICSLKYTYNYCNVMLNFASGFKAAVNEIAVGISHFMLAIAAPYKYMPTIHIPEATLKEYDDKVEAFQKEGKRAYKYQPHGGISVYAFPDNTIAVCSHSGFGGFNLQLTFADGTVFFTEDVVQGIAHYKTSSTDTICDAAALSPREVSIKPISSVLGGEERREVQEEFEKLQAKIADFQRAGKHVATTEFEPGTFIYSFPDNTISICSLKYGYNYCNVMLNFTSGFKAAVNEIAVGISHFIHYLKPTQMITGHTDSEEVTEALSQLAIDMRDFIASGGVIKSNKPHKGLEVHSFSTNIIVIYSKRNFNFGLKITFANGLTFITAHNVVAGLTSYRLNRGL